MLGKRFFKFFASLGLAVALGYLVVGIGRAATTVVVVDGSNRDWGFYTDKTKGDGQMSLALPHRRLV